MVTIHNTQEASVQLAASAARGSQMRETPPAVKSPAPEPVAAEGLRSANPTDEAETPRALAERVQTAIDQAAIQPHQVTFRRDEAINGFVIEIRNPDGTLSHQFPAEKMLNLRRKMDELSGMVIDAVT